MGCAGCGMKYYAEQTGWAARRLRYQRPMIGIGLIMALAISAVAGVFACYGVLVWRFFLD
jgi:hypothetical protein